MPRLSAAYKTKPLCSLLRISSKGWRWIPILQWSSVGSLTFHTFHLLVSLHPRWFEHSHNCHDLDCLQDNSAQLQILDRLSAYIISRLLAFHRICNSSYKAVKISCVLRSSARCRPDDVRDHFLLFSLRVARPAPLSASSPLVGHVR